ncbi:DNA repair protein RadA [Moorella naiadis (nom. illeg.)]|uniref:DNA repair protein RadA n=1 Tax=Moorella naiadis (nom. illeg.) TaxID=3093670 RepID=UPI003D9C9117
MAKLKERYVCQQCGYESLGFLGRCPGCDSWNSLVLEPEITTISQNPAAPAATPVLLAEVNDISTRRLVTSLGEWDRVLGGGLVPGSLVLVGGAPGIGKSTLLLQVAHLLACKYGCILYVTGEESAGQTRLRAQRLGALDGAIYLLAETNIEAIIDQIEKLQPAVVIIDSIQTMILPEVQAAPGSVSQVREGAARFLRLAKGGGPAVLLVGHVTKEGFLAGPRVLEHLVDCVLYLEGERYQAYRILRAVKNRFGSTNEIGVFEMAGSGLEEVRNPSALLLAERPAGVAGSSVVACLEGTRPLLLEIQALVSRTNFGNPRRLATGIDFNRALLLAAVLEKRAKLPLGGYDIYLNVAGGIAINEPAADLAVCLAIASSLQDRPLESRTLVLGEVGLAGEVRAVTQLERRVEEAARLGFNRFIVPAGNSKGLKDRPGYEVYDVHIVGEALELALVKPRS